MTQPVWAQLDTKWQWEVGHKEHVEVQHEGNTHTGFIYAVDLYTIMLYDEKDNLLGTFPKESMTKIIQ